MVTHKPKRYLENLDAPQPMDESWWEAVLTEDESQYLSRTAKNTRQHEFDTAKRAPTRNVAYNEPDEDSQQTVDWEKALELYEHDQVIELLVTGCNRGGLLVNGEGIQGFVPVSHLIEIPCNDIDPEQWLDSFLDRMLQLKVIECDQERGRVVFSERAAQSQPGTRRRLLESLQPGDCVHGLVTNVTDFGIFVDLGGVEGLVHVSEISWGRVHHPADVVQLGQEVEAHVIHVDQERARIALSLKRLRQNPWETAEERYFPGQVTQATVTSIVPFGAFARLEEGLDGLIHISEMSAVEESQQLNPLREGQEIQVRVLHVDSNRQRLGLSLKLN